MQKICSAGPNQMKEAAHRDEGAEPSRSGSDAHALHARDVDPEITVSASEHDQVLVDKLGLTPGMAVLEIGWDDDVDDDIRVMIEDAVDSELIEEAVEAVDLVLLWWRDGDGDLADGLVDALTDLTATGYLWLMTPKVGRDGYVDAIDLAEAAETAGLAQTTTATVSADWAATKLVRPKGSRR